MTVFEEMPLLPASDVAHGGRFDYGVAWSLKTALTAAAWVLEGQVGSRASFVSTAGEDFRGHFAELFRANAQAAAADASGLVAALQTAAGFVGQMIDAAHAEDARRRENNEWVRRHNNRDLWDKLGDWFTGEEARPNMNPGPGPTFSTPGVPLGPRQTPSPSGSGGASGGGGTSSARPENLRSFAAGWRGLDEELASRPGGLDGALADFRAQCSWAGLNADGVVRAFRSYVDANGRDAVWAQTVADAFAAAGGEGAVSTLSDAALAAALQAAGVSMTRSALVIDPPTAYGAQPTSGYADDPVNTATGNFIEPETDLGFGGPAASLALTRMYNSLDERTGVFGPGWSSVLDVALYVGDESARWRMADGREVVFPRQGQEWGRGAGEDYWLSVEPAGGESFRELSSVPEGVDELLVVRDNAGAWWAFTGTGVWVGAGAGAGRSVSVRRGADGKVTRLAHARGRMVDVDHVDGRVVAARASDGRRVEYIYDPDGHLAQVRTPGGSRRYEYEGGRITAVVSAAGVVEVRNTYDESGRVVAQVSRHGRRTRFAYLPGRVTVVSDEDGSRSDSWIQDARGRLVGVIDSLGQRQSMAYDPHGNLVSLTGRDGSVTVHVYDERGRRTRTSTPQGADLSYGYDQWDRLTTLVTGTGGVVAFEYANPVDRDPSVIVDPLGGRTELSWQAGLLTRVVDPTGVSVEFTYDRFGDLIATRNGAGDQARILRDQAGRPVTAITPSGACTDYRYDTVGNLTGRRDPDGAVWGFEYDEAGRLTAVVDPLGARTSLEYGDSGDLVRSVDPLRRVVQRMVDDLGNVDAVVLPDGARWGFRHDSLSRLVGITDPAGGVWRREYDRVGTLTATIDPTGVRRGVSSDEQTRVAVLADAFAAETIHVDEYGRPSRRETADGSAELVSYDPVGNPVELVDGEGGLTRISRDAAGRVTAVTSPAGATTRYAYDACGRPWKATDSTGATTILGYDADQRLVSRTLPTGEVERFSYDVCGRLTGADIPGRGVTRYAYDRCGRLIRTQDPWYGIRRFRYDPAGQLIETINGLGGRTRFDYDQRGRLVRITDPTGGVRLRSYTQLDRVESSTDPLGRVTRAGYDPAGRQTTQTDPDGHTTTWSFDAAGRESGAACDGRPLYTVHRDLMTRTLTVTDHTPPDGLLVDHQLGFNRRGQLTSHTRGNAAMTWTYDTDGNPTSRTDPDGVTTRYLRDAAGRLTGVENPRLGRASFSYDQAGRLTGATADDLRQSWTYQDGYPATHVSTSPVGTDVTRVERDESGRITRITRGDTSTDYTYDLAGQLVGVTARQADGDVAVSHWVWDTAGRLTRQTTPEGTTRFSYDQAGQLVQVTHPDGRTTRYAHDGSGRRVRRIDPDGTWAEYVWGHTGYLTAAATHTPDGETTSTHRLWVDALGNLADLDGAPVWWDTTQPIPTLAGIGDTQVLVLPGLTGLVDGWAASGWRTSRATNPTDPWAVAGGLPTTPPAGPTSPTGPANPQTAGGLAGVLPTGVDLTPTGGLTLAGLEWLGARVYEPATRRFLSTDPLPPVLGAGWDANPYSYAGNNPLGLADPTGLRPLTDQDLQAFDATTRGAFAAADDWLADNWEYLVAGAMVATGVALMCTGVGGPAGIAIMAASGAALSGGISTATQKATTGQVDWGRVGIDAAIGGVAGGVGGAGFAAGRQAVQTASSLSRLGGSVAVNVAANASVGAAGGAVSYTVNHRGAWDFRTFVGHTVGGGVAGGISGLAGPVGGSLAQVSGRTVTSLTANVWRFGVGSGGAIVGSALSASIGGRGMTWEDIVRSTVVGGLGAFVPGGPTQSGSLTQMAWFNPSTLSGAFSTGVNSLRLWGSASVGAAIGVGVDRI